MEQIHSVDQLSMTELIQLVEHELAHNGVVTLSALDPDDFLHVYNGEPVQVNGDEQTVIRLKAWMDLAEVCSARLLVPVKVNDRLHLRFRALKKESSFHVDHPADREKYGSKSRYAQVFKNSDPHFAKDYFDALQRCQLSPESSILNLGINRGDEFEMLSKEQPFAALKHKLVGLDHSLSALKQGKLNNPDQGIQFICGDVESLPFSNKSNFDLLVSINTLHGSKFDGKAVFRYAFKNLLSEQASVILGFPNCRYVDGEVIYGGKMKNFSRHDFSLLLKDLQYYKKYLQGHKKRVFLTGKYTLFLTAIPI